MQPVEPLRRRRLHPAGRPHPGAAAGAAQLMARRSALACSPFALAALAARAGARRQDDRRAPSVPGASCRRRSARRLDRSGLRRSRLGRAGAADRSRRCRRATSCRAAICPGRRRRRRGRSTRRSRARRCCFARASPSPTPARVRVLDLRVAYGDGFIAYVNGREVARRGMGRERRRRRRSRTAPRSSAYRLPSPRPPSRRCRRTGTCWRSPSTPGRAAAPSSPRRRLRPSTLGAASGVRIVRGPYLSTPTEGQRGRTACGSNWETDLPATGDGRSSSGRPPPHAAIRPRRIEVRRPATRHVGGPLDGLDARRCLQLRGRGRRRRRRRRAQRRPRFETVAGAGPAVPLRRLRRHALPGPRRAPRDRRGAGARGAAARLQHRRSHRRRQRGVELAEVLRDHRAAGGHRAGGAGARQPRRRSRAARARRSPGRCSACRPRGRPAGPRSISGGVHFVILSTNEMRNPAQRDWLREDLARARRHHARAIFAFCHEGPWSHALHAGESIMVHDYAPLLAAAHVDVLFSGHDHVYERGVGDDARREADLRRQRRRRRAALQPALPGRDADRRRSACRGRCRPARPSVAVLTNDLPLHHGRGRPRDADHALPAAPRRHRGRALRRAFRRASEHARR